MIQRIQTIWLLIAGVLSVVTLKLAFFGGNITDATGVKVWSELNGTSNFLMLLLTVGVTVLSAITLFLFKNRKLQLRLTAAAIIVSLLLITLYFVESQKYTEGKYALTSIFTFAMPVFLVLAARAIYKDEQLVKSADRFR
ncbi:MAG: DUF4293 domain-containing protein [Chitinophagaceae bacterium]|uniref:DUF4293 domain-containing protein n=1 Tax=unclassified Paraflavitalea TaxID=2798305 RepID=UPI003D357EC9|nr:DUF4293 domain-containing protein [Chitinophagaceae bacterium]